VNADPPAADTSGAEGSYVQDADRMCFTCNQDGKEARMKKAFAVVIVGLVLAGCGSSAPNNPVGPAGTPAATPAGTGTTWTIVGTSITGKTFSFPQALAQALSCPVTSPPQGNGIPSFAKAGLYCTLNGNDPVMVVTFATQAAEQQEFAAYQSSDACMLVGPGWIVWDTQPNGTPPCDQAAALIGGTRADLLP
jgi:hypothetical protein